MRCFIQLNRRRILAWLGVLLVAALCVSPYMVAAQSVPVAITPTRLEFVAKPGEHLAGTLQFWNGMGVGLPVHLEAADFSTEDEEGHVTVGGEEDPVNSLKAWVEPVYPDVTVMPKEKMHFDFAIHVPANADPGSHWGVILVSTAGEAGGSGASTQVKIGTIILVRVLGEVTERLTLESLDAPGFLEGPPVELAARFRNEGTVHESPQGSVEVRNLLGKVVATGTLPVRNVLPGSVRKVGASVGDGFWFGRYSAILSATWGSDRRTLSARLTFWVVPWRTVGPSLAVWAGLVVFLILKRRNIKPFFRALGSVKK